MDRNTPIQRVNHPDPDTHERREMAAVIQEHWHSDMSLNEMAELAGYSRQHALNTLESHFKPVEIGDKHDNGKENGKVTIKIDVPKGVPRDEYLEAWLRGYKSGYRLSQAWGGKSTKVGQ